MDYLIQLSPVLSLLIYSLITITSLIVGYTKFKFVLDDIIKKQAQLTIEKQEFNLEVMNLRLAIVELKGEIKELRVVQQMHMAQDLKK